MEVSALGGMDLDANRRHKFRNVWRPEFGLHQPAAVSALWNMGGLVVSTKLYGRSYRLLGR